MSAKYHVLLSLLVLSMIPAFQPAQAGLLNAALLGHSIPSASAQASSSYDWFQFGFDAQHSGNNTTETKITRANVGQLRKLFQVALPDIADGAPVYLHSVRTSSGVKDLLFVTTRAGHITALDARTGAQVWMKQYGAGSCLINNNPSRNEPCYTTSSPALDPNRRYVYSYGLDGKVHKYRVQDGREIMRSGWPQLATRKGYDEKGSSAFSLATARNGTTFLYVTNGGYPGDAGDYQGHVTAINLATGSQCVFNAVCTNQTVHFVDSRVMSGPDCPAVQTAIWARPGVVYDPATDRIYMATGNGTFDPPRHYWGDTLFAIRPNGTGTKANPVDTYTPTNFQQLQDTDLDLGSTAPAILPAPANSSVQHLAVQSGKDGALRLLNLDNLSGQGGPGHMGGEVGAVINVPQGGEVLTQPAVWVNPNDGSTWVFVANGIGISGLQLMLVASHTPKLQPMWQSGNGGTSPILANGVLFYVGSGNVWALDPTNGSQLWHDTQIGGIHWESPIVANGVLYIADGNSNLTAYSLNGR